MKKLLPPFRSTLLWILLALFVFSLGSGCAMLRGDPRKNCNHPQHGEYMLEKQMERIRSFGG